VGFLAFPARERFHGLLDYDSVFTYARQPPVAPEAEISGTASNGCRTMSKISAFWGRTGGMMGIVKYTMIV
jgi:hypothetical protein